MGTSKYFPEPVEKGAETYLIICEFGLTPPEAETKVRAHSHSPHSTLSSLKMDRWPCGNGNCKGYPKCLMYHSNKSLNALCKNIHCNGDKCPLNHKKKPPEPSSSSRSKILMEFDKEEFKMVKVPGDGHCIVTVLIALGLNFRFV